MILPLLALAMLAAPNQEASASRRGSALVNECKAFIKVVESADVPSALVLADANYCMGYFDGLVSYMDKDSSHVCLTSFSTSTLARIYIRYMEAHPKLFDEDEKIGAYLAILDSYPCPAK